MGKGETLGKMVGEGCEGTEQSGASAFPVHLGTGEAVELPGLILCPRSLLSAAQSPSLPIHPHPGLYLYTRRPPPTELGLNPTHIPSRRALSPNSGTPHSRGPPFHGCLSSSAQVLSRGPTARLNVALPGPCPTLKHHPPHPPRSHPT